MNRLFILIAAIFAFWGTGQTATLSIYPETWAEYYDGGPIITEPEFVHLAYDRGPYAGYSEIYWEYSLINSPFVRIDQATININNLDPHAHSIRINTYYGDGTINNNDWATANYHYDTYLNSSIFAGSNSYDLTEGLRYAFGNQYEYFGVMTVLVNRVNPIYIEIDSNASIHVAGKLVPITSAVWLLGSGLIALWGLRRKLSRD